MGKKNTKLRILACLNAILVLIALALSIVSSNTAYALNNLNLVIIGCAATAALDVIAVALSDKLPGVIVDIMFFATAVLTALALCTMIQGRVLLMGYIYFSDLESNNPIAIAAMNKAIISWVLYAIALLINFAIGFSKHAKD